MVGLLTHIAVIQMKCRPSGDNVSNVTMICQLACGVTTNVITACKVSHAGDCPTLKPLLAETVSRFKVTEVSADMPIPATAIWN